MEVWEEELEIRGSTMPDDEKRKAIRHKKPRESNWEGSAMDGQMVDASITENCWRFFKVLSSVQNGRQ